MALEVEHIVDGGVDCEKALCRAVGSELVGHDGGWSDTLLLQEFSHQLERRLAVSSWLNQDVQDLAFAVDGTPDVQLSAVDGDEHFVEMPRPRRPWAAG